LKSITNCLRNKICLKKIQALISFDFRFKFFLSFSVYFFCYHFSHAIIVVMFFSWCISSIGTEDQIPALCYNVRYFFTYYEMALLMNDLMIFNVGSIKARSYKVFVKSIYLVLESYVYN
jgi:hypothetical protein